MKYRIGQIVEGRITGIQPYGAFVELEEHVCGLIHISEISDGYVRDIGRFVSVGDIVQVKVIDYDEDAKQARLSLKALQHNRIRSGAGRVGARAALPERKLGFSSLSKQLDGWIRKAEKEIK